MTEKTRVWLTPPPPHSSTFSNCFKIINCTSPNQTNFYINYFNLFFLFQEDQIYPLEFRFSDPTIVVTVSPRGVLCTDSWCSAFTNLFEGESSYLKIFSLEERHISDELYSLFVPMIYMMTISVFGEVIYFMLLYNFLKLNQCVSFSCLTYLDLSKA